MSSCVEATREHNAVMYLGQGSNQKYQITDNAVEDIITHAIIITEIIHKDLKMLMVIEISQTIITKVNTEITYMLQMVGKTPTFS